ncbi:MAG: NAD-dependent epimerase/dehydratase family protein [Candidatus Liptonbacteria bacterium]|nr:NAD-dependent epimerase/dehydratase family protein [Candidatus Liptonbacteria bacterium]
MLDLKTKKILVTGASGFLGTHARAALKARGVEDDSIVAPTRKTYDFRERSACAEAVKGVDVVLHLAGVTGNTEFHKSEPARTYYDNLIMGVYLMETARAAGVQKFVTIGSATEYPERAPLPFREDDLWIGPLEADHAPYTVAKKMLSVQSRAYSEQYGFRAVHLIMTNMYGPGENVESGVFIPTLIKKVLEAKANSLSAVEMHGNGDATRDFIYVKDAAEAICLAAEKGERPDPINIASGWEISVRELAGIVKDIAGFEGTITFSPRAGGQPRRVLDTTRARVLLGFQAQTDFRTGIEETIKDFSARMRISP